MRESNGNRALRCWLSGTKVPTRPGGVLKDAGFPLAPGAMRPSGRTTAEGGLQSLIRHPEALVPLQLGVTLHSNSEILCTRARRYGALELGDTVHASSEILCTRTILTRRHVMPGYRALSLAIAAALITARAVAAQGPGPRPCRRPRRGTGSPRAGAPDGVEQLEPVPL